MKPSDKCRQEDRSFETCSVTARTCQTISHLLHESGFLLYADDETPTTFHITKNFAGVTIHGNAVKCISYPSAGTTLQLAAILGNVFYFSAQESLYRCPLETKASERVVDNSTNNSAFNVNKISVFRKSTVFTDPDDSQVKEYKPETKAVTNIIGSGQERSSDGSEKSASLIQVDGICTYEKSLFVTDVAAGTITLVTCLSEALLFLKTLGCLYDTLKFTKKESLEKR